MNDPWLTQEPGFAARSTPTPPGSDGGSAPQLVRRYERAGDDVLAVTDHSVRSDPHRRRRPRAPECRGELSAPGAGRPRARTRITGFARRPGRRALVWPDRGWIIRNGSVAVSPAHTGQFYPGRARAAGARFRDQGLQRRLRARGGAGTLGGALGREARIRPTLLRADNRRGPWSGLRLRSSRGRGCRSTSAPRSSMLRRAPLRVHFWRPVR